MSVAVAGSWARRIASLNMDNFPNADTIMASDYPRTRTDRGCVTRAGATLASDNRVPALLA